MPEEKFAARGKMKRVAARRTQLFKKRKTSALTIALNDRQEFLLSNFVSEMMSDEETDEETNGYLSRTIPWRTEEMNEFITHLDAHSKENGMKKKRTISAPSERKPSMNIPEEFVNRECVVND